MPLRPASYSPVSAMRSARCCLPGSYFRPAEPTPATSPNEAPLRATHSLPFGPSPTNGMRSLSSCVASEVKRSGGSQIMSRWQSAEIRLYCMASPPPAYRMISNLELYATPSCAPDLVREMLDSARVVADSSHSHPRRETPNGGKDLGTQRPVHGELQLRLSLSLHLHQPAGVRHA